MGTGFQKMCAISALKPMIAKNDKPGSLKKVYTPKPNYEACHLLGLCVLFDWCTQVLVLSAYQTFVETHADPRSFGL